MECAQDIYQHPVETVAAVVKKAAIQVILINSPAGTLKQNFLSLMRQNIEKHALLCTNKAEFFIVIILMHTCFYAKEELLEIRDWRPF